MLPNRITAAPNKPNAGTRRPAPGLGLATAGSPDWGGQMAHTKKLREGRVEVLGGRHFVNRHNNQPKVGYGMGVGICDETRPGRNAWGGLFPVIWGGK
jgi:hypothetical protein